MWALEKGKVWESLTYLIDKIRECIKRDEELLKIIQEERHRTLEMELDIMAIKEKLGITEDK